MALWSIPRSRKRLTIFGAYGGINAGDEMILRALLQRIVRESGADQHARVIVDRLPKGQSLTKDYVARNVVPVSFRDIARSLSGSWGSDLVIGGGQVIDGLNGIKYPLLQLAQALIAKASGGQVSILGASCARLENSGVRAVYARLFAACDAISARDEHSAQDIRAIGGANLCPVKTEADLVFGMRDTITSNTPLADRKLILLAPHHAPSLPLTDVEASALLLEKLTKLGGDHEVRLILHDDRPDFDTHFVRRLRAIMGDAMPSASNPKTTDETIALYQQARMVISVRMHPIIIGACAGAACVPIKGSRKQEDLAGRIGLTTVALTDAASKSPNALQKWFDCLPDQTALRDLERLAK